MHFDPVDVLQLIATDMCYGVALAGHRGASQVSGGIEILTRSATESLR